MKNYYISLIFFLLIYSCAPDQPIIYDKDGKIKTLPIEVESPKEIAILWNDAINNKRWDILNSIYADDVYYYANIQTKEKCLERKIKATEKDESFSQNIEEISVVQTYNNTYEIYFQKSFSVQGKQDTILAFLSTVYSEEKGWKIVQESDYITSRNKGNKICNCSDFWVALFNGGNSTYYLLSGIWDTQIVYIGNDGSYYLHIDYGINDHEISFMTRENLPTHTSLVDINYFDLKTNKMTLEDHSGDRINEKYNKRFFKRLNEFCK